MKSLYCDEITVQILTKIGKSWTSRHCRYNLLPVVLCMIFFSFEDCKSLNPETDPGFLSITIYDSGLE